MNLPSTLVKVLVRVDSQGRLLLPFNVRRALQLKENQVVELKIVGSSRNRRLLLSSRTTR